MSRMLTECPARKVRLDVLELEDRMNPAANWIFEGPQPISASNGRLPGRHSCGIEED